MTITTGAFDFFILCCVFSAQYWAYKCCLEQRKTNEKLDRVIELQKR
jgi:hypothetical protein